MEVIGLPNAKGILLARAKSHETPRSFKINGPTARAAHFGAMKSTFP
jgi:hypothetical protein